MENGGNSFYGNREQNGNSGSHLGWDVRDLGSSRFDCNCTGNSFNDDTATAAPTQQEAGMGHALMFPHQTSTITTTTTNITSSRSMAGDGSHLLPDPHLMGLKPGKRHYFEDSTPGISTDKRGRPYYGGWSSQSSAKAVSVVGSPETVPRCQVDGCHVALVNAKRYYQRHKVCEMHTKAPEVVVLGLKQRFCQQCSRFHALSEFDDRKRSCRKRLVKHIERRRKSSHESVAGTLLKGDGLGRFNQMPITCGVRVFPLTRELGHKPDRETMELCGRGLREAPEDEVWKEAGHILLMNNEISELPSNPHCPKLSKLSLQANHHLRVIPPLFFKRMPVLQILDLSHTRIRRLPQSLFKLVPLRQLFLKHCQLFMELPPEIGELSHLEVLDLEGTEIINLPATIGKLTNLRCLKVSFYGEDYNSRKNHKLDKVIIPKNVISNLLQLEELSIDVNPEDERWNVIVKDIVKEVCSLNWLDSLKLYLPEVVLLNDLRNGSLSTNLSLMQYWFTVGSHMKRIISRLPQEVAGKFEEEERCLKYVNGEGVPTEIKEVLQRATALFLDRHLTLTSLSEFGIGSMENLKFCVLGECDQVQTIVDTDNDGDVLLESLQYLNLHYMKNLKSIWKGSLGESSLISLKSMTLCTCPQLATVFTLNLLENLGHLEELVVEDCPQISSIVTCEDLPDLPLCMDYLPKLKKISLHYLPKLVSISSGLRIAPNLEWMSFYGCPSLRTLSPEECRLDNLKVIIGEANWWSELRWEKSEWLQPSYLDSIFVPIERDRDLKTQLTELNNQLHMIGCKKQSLLNSQVLEQAQSRSKYSGHEVATLRTPTGLSSFKLDECDEIKPQLRISQNNF